MRFFFLVYFFSWSCIADCSNEAKIADRIQTFIGKYSRDSSFQRELKVFNIRQGGRPVKPLELAPVYVKRKNGRVIEIHQIDPTHGNEVEIYNGEGKVLRVEDFGGKILQHQTENALKQNRNFFKNAS